MRHSDGDLSLHLVEAVTLNSLVKSTTAFLRKIDSITFFSMLFINIQKHSRALLLGGDRAQKPGVRRRRAAVYNERGRRWDHGRVVKGGAVAISKAKNK